MREVDRYFILNCFFSVLKQKVVKEATPTESNKHNVL